MNTLNIKKVWWWWHKVGLSVLFPAEAELRRYMKMFLDGNLGSAGESLTTLVHSNPYRLFSTLPVVPKAAPYYPWRAVSCWEVGDSVPDIEKIALLQNCHGTKQTQCQIMVLFAQCTQNTLLFSSTSATVQMTWWITVLVTLHAICPMVCGLICQGHSF